MALPSDLSGGTLWSPAQQNFGIIPVQRHLGEPQCCKRRTQAALRQTSEKTAASRRMPPAAEHKESRFEANADELPMPLSSYRTPTEKSMHITCQLPYTDPLQPCNWRTQTRHKVLLQVLPSSLSPANYSASSRETCPFKNFEPRRESSRALPSAARCISMRSLKP